MGSLTCYSCRWCQASLDHRNEAVEYCWHSMPVFPKGGQDCLRFEYEPGTDEKERVDDEAQATSIQEDH